MCVSRLSGVIYFNQKMCTVVSKGVASLGSCLCFVVAGSSSVALRVSVEVRRVVLGPVLFPFGSLRPISYHEALWHSTGEAHYS